VIPEVVKVIEGDRPENTMPYFIPDRCPVCRGHVIRIEGEAKHYCQNISCPAQIKGRIGHFVAKRCMDIDGFGTKLVAQLVEESLILTIADIYALSVEKLSPLERMAEKSAQNLVNAIHASRSADLWRLIHGLGIRNVGEHVAKLLADSYGTLEAISKATVEELESLHEIGPIVARGVVAFFAEEENQRLINQLIAAGVNTKNDNVTVKSGILNGKSFVFTGKLELYNRDTARELVESLGGTTSNAISKKIDFLVAGPGAGSKLEKAAKLGIKVITEKEFKDMAGGA
jgi:DNA ligase (NAD+)